MFDYDFWQSLLPKLSVTQLETLLKERVALGKTIEYNPLVIAQIKKELKGRKKD